MACGGGTGLLATTSAAAETAFGMGRGFLPTEPKESLQRQCMAAMGSPVAAMFFGGFPQAGGTENSMTNGERGSSLKGCEVRNRRELARGLSVSNRGNENRLACGGLVLRAAAARGGPG